MKLSIVIPVFNEVRTVDKIIGRVRSIRLPAGWEKEVIIIDDGSSDGTKEKIEKLRNKEIRKFFHHKNLGKGAAVRNGIKNATGEVLVIQDADLEYDPNDFRLLLEPIIRQEAQVVYGSRLKELKFKLKGRRRTPLPLHYLTNRFLSFLTNVFYGSSLTDMETGYKMMTRQVYQNLKLTSSRFEIEPEITAKILKKGLKILEIPIRTKPRGYKEGKKIKSIDALKAVWTLLRYAFD